MEYANARSLRSVFIGDCFDIVFKLPHKNKNDHSCHSTKEMVDDHCRSSPIYPLTVL